MSKSHDDTNVAPVVLLVLGGISVLIVMAASTINKNQPLTYNSSAQTAHCIPIGQVKIAGLPCCSNGVVDPATSRCVLNLPTPTPTRALTCTNATCTYKRTKHMWCSAIGIKATQYAYIWTCNPSSCQKATTYSFKTYAPASRCLDGIMCNSTQKCPDGFECYGGISGNICRNGPF